MVEERERRRSHGDLIELALFKPGAQFIGLLLWRARDVEGMEEWTPAELMFGRVQARTG